MDFVAARTFPSVKGQLAEVWDSDRVGWGWVGRAVSRVLCTVNGRVLNTSESRLKTP